MTRIKLKLTVCFFLFFFDYSWCLQLVHRGFGFQDISINVQYCNRGRKICKETVKSSALIGDWINTIGLHSEHITSRLKGPDLLDRSFMHSIYLFMHLHIWAGLGGSVGWASDWWSGVADSTPVSLAKFFHGDGSWNIFYGHSFPSTNSRSAFFSFWWKNVHNTC